jgi:hypothetical protein
MPRRVGLPGAAELFRSTDVPPPLEAVEPLDRPTSGREETSAADPEPRGTGRVRHDEKITVYVSIDELLALEQARLTLRARHGMAVDRGRIVREAIAATLADLDARAGESELVRRLTAP